MGRIVGIDFGKKRIGIAVSDISNSIALPFTTLLGEKSTQLSAELVAKTLQKESFSTDIIVIGLPLLLSGKESDMAHVVKEFGSHLHHVTSIEITYFDERLSSKAADSAMREHKVKRKKRAKSIDTIAATFILQAYLDLPKNK